MNDDREKDGLRKRLRRIEGQARGVQRMIEEDVPCGDVLTQIIAMTRALDSVALVLMNGHLRDCVRDAVTNGTPAGEEKIAEVSAVIARLVRT